jgi:hypothetical protein
MNKGNGSMQATLLRPQVRTGQSQSPSKYTTGVTDGAACRKPADTLSIYQLVAKDDDYSSGFRAGYFQRGCSNPEAVIDL